MSEIQRDLKIDKRVVKQLSESAIKKDPVRAIVELITNSDDSYRRMEANGFVTKGDIFIELVRKRKNSCSQYYTIDQAEGFDDKTMDERVGGFGCDTSGLTDGFDVRGYFGRGLKEAILGLGCGKVMSVKDDFIYECELTEEAIYKRKKPVKIGKNERKELVESLGFYRNGTVITINVTKAGIATPQIDTLQFQLERYFSLRDINSSDKRKVFIIEKNDLGKPKDRSIKLEYKPPIGEAVLSVEKFKIIGFDGVEGELRVFKSKESLTQDGPCREGGILIKSKIAIHDITLFGFENNPYAQKLFGTFKCAYIDELIKKGEPVLSDRREGLDWSYAFCKAIKASIENELKKIVEDIKNEEEKLRKLIENEKTRQRFRSAIERINDIAKKELGLDGEGLSQGKDGKPSNPPPNGFDFVPDYYHIIAGQRSSLTFKATVPWIVPIGATIAFESDSEDVTIEEKIFKVTEDRIKDSMIIINPKIKGKRVGAEVMITANCDNLQACTVVKVVASIERGHDPKKRSGKVNQGLFEDIKYDSSLPSQIRHYFDRQTRVVKISVKNPCVQMYLGLNGEGQDKLHSQVLIAELVTDAVCREVARRKAESGRLPVLGEAATALDRELNRLINEYAHVIHCCLVDLKNS